MNEPTFALTELEQLVNSGRLRRAVDARVKADERQDAQKELQVFEQHCEKFVGASAVAASAIPFMDPAERKRLQSHVSRIRGLATKIGEAARNEGELRDFGRLLSDGKSHVENATQLLEQAFERSLEKTFAPLESLATLVSGIPSLEQLGREFARLAQESRQLTTKFPPADPGLKLLRDLIERREAAMDQLSASNAGAELTTFLVKVASREATLADVTPNVRKFLDGQNASRLFRIRFET